MRFDTTIDFGRSLSWWPFTTVLGGHRTPGGRKILAIWGAATVVSVGFALLEAWRNWSGIPVAIGDWTVGFTFYPPVMIGLLLTLWIGPGCGAATAYLSTLVSGLYSGLSLGRAAFFALGSPIELVLFWFLLLILRVQPDLPRLRDLGLFASAGLIAATASSVDIMLYNAAHKVALAEGQRLWLGWILGDFFQMMVLVAPLLRMSGKKVQAYLRQNAGVPPQREISTGQIMVLLFSVWATLGLLVFLGVRLLERALDIPSLALTSSGDPLVPRLREMGLFVGVFVVVLLITTMALTATLAGVGDQHRERSLRDDLTGCFNRRAFKRLFDREAERSEGLNLPMSIVFFDIDHFKSLNDRLGHAAGDAVLTSVARQTTDILSAQELLFRWGGEEFLVLLSHTGGDDAFKFAERLRSRIEEKVTVSDDSDEHVTISLGVASGAPPDFDEISLIRNADSALYHAKTTGRNRVVTDAMMRGRG
jgi:diguanylate cyclase (GGDEF)-like protein